MHTPAALYRIYAPDGTLLYVGVSMTLLARLAQHRADKGWWTDVGRVEIASFDTAADAKAAETAAIRDEAPTYNVLHNGKSVGAPEYYALTDLESQLRVAGEQAALWTQRRDGLIRAAGDSIPLRQLGRAAGLSHTAVAKIQSRGA